MSGALFLSEDLARPDLVSVVPVHDMTPVRISIIRASVWIGIPIVRASVRIGTVVSASIWVGVAVCRIAVAKSVRAVAVGVRIIVVAVIAPVIRGRGCQ